MAEQPARGATASHLSIGEVLGLLLEEFPDVTISKIRFLESQLFEIGAAGIELR